MLGLFRQRRGFVKVVLWILVVMLAVSLVAWFADPGIVSQQPSQGAKQSSQTEKQTQTAGQLSGTARLEAQLQQLQQMATSKPNNISVLTGSARVESQLAQAYSQEGKKEQSIAFFHQAALDYQKLLSQMDDQTMRLELAGVFKYLGDFSSADAQYKAILKVDPKNSQVRLQQGLLHEAQQDWKGAAAIWLQLAQDADISVKDFAAKKLKEVQPKLK